MASTWNSRPKASGLGAASKPASETAEKSTLPSAIASAYPVTTPTSKLAWRRKPFPKRLSSSVTKKTTPAINRFTGAP